MIKNESQVAPEQVDQHPRKPFKLPIRVAAFLFALIIAGSTCIFGFAQSVYALFDDDFDYQAPFGFMFDEIMTYAGLPFGVDFPFSVSTSVNLTDYNYARIDDTGIAFGQSSDSYNYVYLWSSGWVDRGPFWLYSTGIPDVDLSVYESMVDVLSAYGSFYLLHDSYRFKETNLTIPTLLSTQFNFSSNGVQFEGIHCITNSIYYIDDGVDVLVYTNGSWVDQSYRNITLSRHVPVYAIFVEFWSVNQFVPPSFLDRLGSGLTSVITWFGSVLTALTTGSLAPVFWFIAVAVGVSLLGLGFNWLRRFIFGW